MAYIPPHKRHTQDTDKPGPSPASLVPQFRTHLSLGSPNSSSDRKYDKNKLPGSKVIYASTAVSRWFAIGLKSEDGLFHSSVVLQHVPLDNAKWRHGDKPLVLVITGMEKRTDEEGGPCSPTPWGVIAKNVLQDLLSSLQVLRNEMEDGKLVEVKPALVARFGKILFHGSRSENMKTIRSNTLSEYTLEKLKKSFYTNVPSSYIESFTTDTTQKIGVDFEKEKEAYHVKLSDSKLPDATISCKCKVTPDRQRLELYKIEMNQVRHFVADVSCITKELDLRLMLCTKRIINTLSDDEKQSVRDLISSAVLDSNTKGGLRWPLGKDSSGGRYRVVGVWHTKAEAYKNSCVRLRIRSADRFDFRTSTGEFSREVVLKLTGMVSKLKEPNVEVSSLQNALADNIKLMWNHFLDCTNYFTQDLTPS